MVYRRVGSVFALIFGMQQDPINKTTKMRRFWLAYIAAWLCAIVLYVIHYMS
jgi:hypothetical protein